MIITDAPVGSLPFEEINYWKEQGIIVKWSGHANEQVGIIQSLWKYKNTMLK